MNPDADPGAPEEDGAQRPDPGEKVEGHDPGEKVEGVLSKSAQKKLARSQRKAAFKAKRKRENEAQQQQGFEGSAAGKAGRARQARMGINNSEGGRHGHRARGGAPVQVAREHVGIVAALEEVENTARLASLPGMTKRAVVPMDCHGSMDPPSSPRTLPVGAVSLRNHGLREFSTGTIGDLIGLRNITMLDVSRNELWALPGLNQLQGLRHLDISRNWFEALPEGLVALKQLVGVDASYNMLRANNESLQLTRLATLDQLRRLDIGCNQKCCKKSHAEMIRAQLPQLEVLGISVAPDGSCPAPAGYFEGSSAAERDATVLRAQLEPWSTSALRRRLVADFGRPATDPATVNRAQVMAELLECYQAEPPRRVVLVDGTTVADHHCHDLLVELKKWVAATEASGPLTRERPSIQASHYMILTAPTEFITGSAKAHKAAAKLEAHASLWEVAQRAVDSVDPEFGSRFTALAVTHNFRGSPHIDKQNVGPFLGISLGDFPEGEGGILVECSARVVACVNTKNRMGKVDGRYPHWVAQYPTENCDRYSVIFYQTVGELSPVGPAIFQIPTSL
eukprot:TRINITY_DN1938_c0_g1_i9.p1 TRINITY_DN1938_c0_g1~~TRINITY_DN1938_c0_g1_i9.p1  ORF type:complete len:567 (+),score=91.15 TRINITY_DN1938_c0_g1_i9:233-1933(+)